MKILVVDIGGNNVKLLASGQKTPRKVPSGPALTPLRMATSVRKAVAGWTYDAVTIGFPGPVNDGRPAQEPVNLGRGWVRFDYARALGKPVRLVNDAVMQALGSYRGGRMLFLGLGTGLGSTLIIDGVVAPMELAHLPYKKGKTFEDFVGRRGLERLGKKAWREEVAEVVACLKAALVADYVVLGGGNAKKLEELPEGCRRGSNQMAYTGGVRMWEAEVSAAGFSLYPQSAQAG